jgi:peptidoglycan/LPS O-acetylase OafA/YrhL
MKRKIPQLDAVRGLAILVVMFHNGGQLQRLFAHGWMGVDLFFVLSGFLITGILVDTRQSEGYFRNFYARRCLRIWPLYYSVLLFMFVVVPLLRPAEGNVIFQKSAPWWAYPIYLQNFQVAIPTEAAGPLGTTWSLAIEEQFYLVWALVVRYCSYTQVRRIAIAVICLSPALRFYLSLHQMILYSNVFCRLDGLMAGAFLALVIRSEGFVPSRYLKGVWILLFVTAPLALVLASLHVESIVYSASAIASALFVYVVLFSRQGTFHAVMTNRFLTYTGTISYGLYLLHKIPLDLVKVTRLAQKPLLALPIAILVSYGLAALSWNLLEQPFLRLKHFFEFNPAHDRSVSPNFALAPEGTTEASLIRGAGG